MSEPVPEPMFDALLQPNRPLAPRGAFYVLGAVAALSFVISVSLVLQGAWPVTPFFGADVGILFWAFAVVARRSRRAERVTLNTENFTQRHYDENGCERESHSLPSAWLRVEHDDPDRLGHELAVASRNHRLIVGRFLGADERASLADALRAALSKLRHF